MPAAESRDAIRQYLQEHFSDAEISDHEEASGAVRFTIQRGELEYAVVLLPEFLQAHSPGTMGDVLTRFALVDELCRAEGLPLTVTERGIRLDSNN